MSTLKRWFVADRTASPSAGLVAAHTLVVLVVMALVLQLAFARIAYHWSWAGVWGYRGRLLHGWVTTIWLSAASLILSTIVGGAAAFARRSPLLPLRQLAVVYVEAIRGTPLLVQILVFFYVVANAFGVQQREIAGIVVLSVFAGAYISEIVRSGIESVGASQLESARAIGLTSAQTYRYVVLPQALRQMLPPLAGQLVSLVKDSSLLSVISIGELTLSAQQVNSYTYSTLESYLPLALGYLVVTLPLSLVTRALERRFRYET